MLSLADLPYVPPHLVLLRDPNLAYDEELVARLSLAAVAPPALVLIDLSDLAAKVRLDRCVLGR